MRALRKTQGRETYFIMADVEPKYHDAVLSLYYTPLEEGFGKAFPSNTPDLSDIYSNFSRYAEEMVLQMAGVHPVPWEKCLITFLQTVESHNIDWWLCGSGALAVRGMEIEPHDIDLVVADADAQKLGNLLSEYLVEPFVRVEDWFCHWFGRAFLGARLEWVGGVDERADQPAVSDFGPTAENHLETVVWRDREIRVPPLELQLKVSKRRGLNERVEMIKRVLENETWIQL
jgi:hypothetical protein